MSDRRAAVIGASGFLGSALVHELTVRGRAPAMFTRSTPYLTPDGALQAELAGADTIFWLASSIRPATADEENAAAAADQARLASLLDGLDHDARASTRVVVVSSGGTVYDPTSPAPHAETAPLAPANSYGVAMLAIERLVRERVRECTVLRVSNAYGPGQVARRGQGVIAHWLTALADGRQVHLMGSDEVARDYVFVGDVVDALVRVHDAELAPPVVNIGSGRPTTLAELLDLVRDTVAPVPVDVVREPGRSFDAPSTWLDISLAREVLGWKPCIELRDGLERTWAGLRSSRSADGS